MGHALAWVLPLIPVSTAIAAYFAIRKRLPKSTTVFLVFFADNPLLWAIVVAMARVYGYEDLLRPLVAALVASVVCGTILYFKLKDIAGSGGDFPPAH